MARPVRTPMDEVGGADDEFQLHLDRGAELLGRGEAEPARESLTRAAELRPGDLKTLGLLGQALYRLGKFDDAAALFGKLVEQNPLEAGAQVNLGLANLRAKRYVEAISHLERALDLNPDHRKAMGYLGLAWLEHGNVARAREWFSRAGSDHMVSRCDELLAAARRSAPAPADPQWTVAAAADAAKGVDEPAPPTGEPPADEEAEITSAMRFLGSTRQEEQQPKPQETPPKPRQPASAWDEIPARGGAAGWKLTPITVIGPPTRCTDPGPIVLPVQRREVAAPPVPAPPAPGSETIALPPPPAEDTASQPSPELLEPTSSPAASEREPAFDVDEAEPVSLSPIIANPDVPLPASLKPRVVTLEEIVASGFPADDTGGPTFSTERGVLRVAVRGEVLARVGKLVAARGDLEMVPETRRYRGRGTDKLFGDGRAAMHRIRGQGTLLLRAATAHHTVVELSGNAGFFREEAVFAMESSIEFDNARLTARAGPDVDLVQLRGDGTFVLVTRGDIVAVDVSEAPLRVAVAALIGWTGALTPRLTTLAEGGSTGDTRAVELTGEGRVLLDSGASDG